jgi:hypothetical protein
MSGKIRFAAAALIVSAMTCGSLSASTLGRRAPHGDEGSTITAFVNWMASLLPWGGTHGKAPKIPCSKIAAQMDPDGNH